jgi:hypothetical protein
VTSLALPRRAAQPRSRGAADAQRSARRCAIAGATFAALLFTALLLLEQLPSLDAPTLDYLRFYAHGTGTLVTIGVYLVPFAGLAFMWFMFSLREVLGRRAGSTMVGGLQLATGIAFLCLLFAGTAAVASAAVLQHRTGLFPLHMETIRAHLGLGYTLVFLYGVRMAGAFMIATTTLAKRRGLLTTWPAAASYAAAVVLLIAAASRPAALVILPAWTLAMSLIVWTASRRDISPSTTQNEVER